MNNTRANPVRGSAVVDYFILEGKNKINGPKIWQYTNWEYRKFASFLTPHEADASTPDNPNYSKNFFGYAYNIVRNNVIQGASGKLNTPVRSSLTGINIPSTDSQRYIYSLQFSNSNDSSISSIPT
jgi:hypothetical protein